MNEKIKKYLYFIIPACLLLFALYLFWGSGLSGNGVRAYRTGEHFDKAGKAIESSVKSAERAEDGIHRVEESIGTSIERIETIDHRNTEIEGRIENSLELNRRGQEIVQGIRKRGKSQEEKTSN